MKNLIRIMVIMLFLTSCKTSEGSLYTIEDNNATDKSPIIAEQSIADNFENGDVISNQEIKKSIIVADEQGENNCSDLYHALDTFDYSEYIHKTWIEKDWSYDNDRYLSFNIITIENGVIEGTFSIGAVAEPQLYNSRAVSDFEGTVSNGVSECSFHYYSKDFDNADRLSAKADLLFKEDGTIEGNVTYAEKYNEKGYNNGMHVFRPFNLLDDYSEKNFDNEKEYEFELDDYGSVYVVTATQKSYRESSYPCAYLTDENYNILFMFITGYPSNSEITNVIVEDVNDDGKKDIVLTVLSDTGEEEWVFYQRYNGLLTLFESQLDSDLRIN